MTSDITPEEEQRYAELQQLALDYARQGETSELEPMLDAGLSPNLADHKSNSLLMLAAYNGNLETARLLLSRGAEVDHRNDRGQTPLGGVAFKGYPELIDLLIEAGAEVDADNGGGMTPYLYAVMFGRTEAEEALERHGASMGRRKRLGIAAHAMGKFSMFMRTVRRKKASPAGHD
ncbi:MAG: ankyrin repeat domain-containing protein [Opitutales bacterium]